MHNLELLWLMAQVLTELGSGAKRSNDWKAISAKRWINCPSGASETEAFRSRSDKLGSPPMIASEFRETESTDLVTG